jgi:hypothetical protein
MQTFLQPLLSFLVTTRSEMNTNQWKKGHSIAEESAGMRNQRPIPLEWFPHREARGQVIRYRLVR